MDEHWDGGGYPTGLGGDDIPLLGRIIGLAQVAEIFSGRTAIRSMALDVVERSGADAGSIPSSCARFASSRRITSSGRRCHAERIATLVSDAEPAGFAIVADDARLDRHRRGVRLGDRRQVAVHVSTTRDGWPSWRSPSGSASVFSTANVVRLRRAALLHDIGKLGVPNRILDKPGPLTDAGVGDRA